MKHLFSFFTIFLIAIAMYAQEYTLEGHIYGEDNKEPLIGATVRVEELHTGASTDFDGYYSIKLKKGTYTITFSYVGYEPSRQTIKLSKNEKIETYLSVSAKQIKTVEITGEGATKNIRSVEMSVNKMDAKTIKQIPAFLGEADVIKSILSLPGVSTVGEGSTGFNVRGGGIDENLVLMDDAPVYNSSHLFGFFSVFNPDAVSEVKLIKGGIEPRYGGRLSSILDIGMREGDRNKVEGSGGIGVIFSRFSIEGPIKKDKVSILLAGRRSYADILAKPFLRKDLRKSQFYFYDLSGKLNYVIDDKNRLSFSAYYGNDIFGADFLRFKWGNATSTLRWNHIFNEKFFLSLTGFYSKYSYAFGLDFKDQGIETGFDWNSAIVSYSLKPDFTYYLNKNNQLKFGIQSIYYDFKPAEASFSTDGKDQDISMTERFALENGVYLQNEQEIGANVTLLYGLRWSHFAYLGPGIKQNYQDTTAGIRKPIKSVEKYDSFEKISDYHFLEPRLSVKYSLDEFSSIKASYNRMTQNLHLISNTVASTPVDIWLPTTNNIKPQIADQIAVGYFRNFKNDTYESSVEVFGKNLKNQIDYIDNADIFFNEELEGDLLSGIGRAYGLELYVKKNEGDLTGWISYTLSRSERKVEGISKGEWYPNRFDRLHNFSIVGNYKLNDKWAFSANFVYSSGTPVTFPTNRYQIQGVILPHNVQEARNNYRIPAYHRLDISATLTPRKNVEKRIKGEWVFSVYNVYSRRNPFAIYFEQDEGNPEIAKAMQFSIIGNFVPAVSYNFNF